MWGRILCPQPLNVRFSHWTCLDQGNVSKMNTCYLWIGASGDSQWLFILWHWPALFMIVVSTWFSEWSWWGEKPQVTHKGFKDIFICVSLWDVGGHLLLRHYLTYQSLYIINGLCHQVDKSSSLDFHLSTWPWARFLTSPRFLSVRWGYLFHQSYKKSVKQCLEKLSITGLIKTQ